MPNVQSTAVAPHQSLDFSKPIVSEQSIQSAAVAVCQLPDTQYTLCRRTEDWVLGEASGRAQRQAERAPGRVLQVAEAVLCADRAQGHAVLFQVC